MNELFLIIAIIWTVVTIGALFFWRKRGLVRHWDNSGMVKGVIVTWFVLGLVLWLLASEII